MVWLNINFRTIIVQWFGLLVTKNSIHKNLNQIIDINKSNFTIIKNSRFLIVCHFMAKSRHHGIVIGFTKWPKYIGNGQGRELSSRYLGPSHKLFLAL